MALIIPDKTLTAARRVRKPTAFMIEGDVGKILARMTLPVGWGILALLAYRLAEAWFIARLGAPALAAVSFAFPVTMVVISLSIGLGAGTSSVIARALGAREEGVPRLVADALILTAIVAFIAAIAGSIAAPGLARLLGAGEDLVPLITGYLRVWFLGAVLFLTASVGLSAARAAGDTTFQGVAMVASTGLNLAAAPVAILGIPSLGVHGLGLVGAPVASIVAWVPLLGATLWRLWQLGVLSFEQVRRQEFLSSSRRILRVGAPAAATNTVIPISSGIITAFLAPYGHDAVAGFGLGSRVESVAMVAFFALSAVMNPFAGQNAAAGRMERVREAVRVTVVFCLGTGAALAVALYFGRSRVALLFTHDHEVVRAAAAYLEVVPLSYGAAGIIAIVNAGFNGLNRPMSAVIISVGRTLLVNVPVAWLGGRLFGAYGIFLGISVSNLLVGAASAIWIWRVTGHRATSLPLRRTTSEESEDAAGLGAAPAASSAPGMALLSEADSTLEEKAL